MDGIPESQMSEFAPDVIALIGTGAAKVIPLTKGKVTVVDAEDYERLAKYRWYAGRHRDNYYAQRDTWINGRKGKSVRMHREILGLSEGDHNLSDHKNRNTLDNRRNNLRSATYSLNNYNAAIDSNNTSGYRGVSFLSKEGKWRAYIGQNRKQVWCGQYASAVEAAMAHDRAALKYWGTAAILNFPDKIKEYDEINKNPPRRLRALPKDNTSGYRGVSWVKRNKRWVVWIVVNKKYIYCGSFTDLLSAAKAYDLAEIKYRGEAANLNFKKVVTI